MVSREAVQGVVLAGGGSTRFGDDEKALATLDGRPLVGRAVAAVAAGTSTSSPLVLSVADPEQGDRLRPALEDAVAGVDADATVEVVLDAAGHAGPLAGLLAATARADRPWLFVCACDMPFVTASGIAGLRGAVPAPGDGAHPRRDVGAVVPVVDGHPQPLHALYRTAAVERARGDLPETASLRALLDRLDPVVHVDPDDLAVDAGRAVTNVNTRGELRRLRADTGESTEP